MKGKARTGKKPGLRKRFVSYVRRKSPWILHMGCGGCNGCAIEVVAAISPRSDPERFGALLKGSPRHADILLVEGPVTRKVKPRLLRIYNQMPEPKLVLAIGACTISQGIFRGCYNMAEPLGSLIPVDVYVPGCPPKPEAILQGLLKALEKLEEK
jgi:NADH-quinone oxidoreductase B subunit